MIETIHHVIDIFSTERGNIRLQCYAFGTPKRIRKNWPKGGFFFQEIKIQLLVCANPEPDGFLINGINTLLRHCPSGEASEGTTDPVRDEFGRV